MEDKDQFMDTAAITSILPKPFFLSKRLYHGRASRLSDVFHRSNLQEAVVTTFFFVKDFIRTTNGARQSLEKHVLVVMMEDL